MKKRAVQNIQDTKIGIYEYLGRRGQHEKSTSRFSFQALLFLISFLHHPKLVNFTANVYFSSNRAEFY